jgi:glycosyltransferase involved in cell wall biosynthesis
VNPLVSIILPTYNSQTYILETVRSVLCQTVNDFELLIVDDYSTDDTLSRLASINDKRVKILKNTGIKGVVNTRNIAIENSRGQYVAQLDSDDLCLPNRLAMQIRYLKEHKTTFICGSFVETFGVHNKIRWILPQHDEGIRAQMLFCGAIANPSVMWRSCISTEFSMKYDEQFNHGAEDYDLWTRIPPKFRFSNVPLYLLKYRTHKNNFGTVWCNEVKLNTVKIQLRLLNALGLKPTSREVQIHSMVSQSEVEDSSSFIQETLEWFSKIRDANLSFQRYDQDALNSYLDEKYNYIVSKVTVKSVPTRRSILQKVASRIPDGSVKLLAERIYWYLYKHRFPLTLLRYMRSYAKISRTLPGNFKIAYAILAYERPEYLECCLDSLFKTKLYNYDIDFYIIDDGSSNERVSKIINKTRDGRYKVIRVFTQKGPNNAGAAINKALKIMSTSDNYDIIGWGDPDAIYNPEWLHMTMQVCLWAKKNHFRHVLGPFSSFNSSDVDFHVQIGQYSSPYGDYCVKRQMGMLNYFYFKKDLELLGYFDENKDDETMMTNRFESMLVRNFCTKNSYLEHIGQDSVLNQWRDHKVYRAVYGLNLAKEDWPESLAKFGTLGFFKDVQGRKTFGSEKSSNLKIDVLIPAAQKDYATLPLVVDSILKNVKHPLGCIHIVSNDNSQIRGICRNSNCSFVNELDLVPFDREKIRYIVDGVDRSGWLLQQFIKLSCDKLGKKDLLICDADTIFVTPQVFELEGKYVLLHSDEFHIPYFNVYKMLTNLPIFSCISCVTHHMLFNTAFLHSLLTHIEDQHNEAWYDAILNNVDYLESSGFSEYELYGQWIMGFYKDNISREYWFNKPLTLDKLPSLQHLESLYAKKFRSVSLHSYCNSF